MLEVHISKHSLFRLKITVGCLVCGVVCAWCVVLCMCACGVCGVLVLCVLLCCGDVWWWCEAWHSLSCSLSLFFSFPFFLSLNFVLSFSFSFSLALTLALALHLFFLPSFLSTHSSLLFPSRQHSLYRALINKHGVQLWGVWMWCGARYVQSNWQRIARNVPTSPPPSSSLLPPPSLPHPEKRWNLFLQEYFWRGFFYYSFRLIPKNRRRVKLQALQFSINSKTIGLQRVKTNFWRDGNVSPKQFWTLFITVFAV